MEIQIRPSASVLAFRFLRFSTIHVVGVIDDQIIIVFTTVVPRAAAVAAAGRMVPQVGVEFAVAARVDELVRVDGRSVVEVFGAFAALRGARIFRIHGRRRGARGVGRLGLGVQRLDVQMLHATIRLV